VSTVYIDTPPPEGVNVALTLIDIPTAAKRIGCSRPHIYDLIAAGKLRRFNISATAKGSKTRVADEDVTAFIQASEQPLPRTA
jgi:excisionase family DNA binding protein